MDHAAHIGFVDTHSERIGSHHIAELTGQPFVLDPFAFRVGQACVVSGRRDPLGHHGTRKVQGASAIAHIHDPTAGQGVEDPEQPPQFVLPG